MSDVARRLLRGWLLRQVGEERAAWLDRQIAEAKQEGAGQALDIALGMIPRRLGGAALQLDERDLESAREAIAGWQPRGWGVSDAARILVLAALPAENFAERFRALCATADAAELVALYRGLPFYPGPAALEPQVGEGLRSNMRDVFEAIAHHNPYPFHHFDEHRWNHMVLKALFIGSALTPIYGLERRANPELARMLRDFAHERWAAGRPVPHEVWHCVGPFAEGDALDDVARALRSEEPRERRAAALAMSASPDRRAKELLAGAPELAGAIARNELTWETC